ncbi:hypothetical protein [Sulfurimonas diazotrophicus]|uniref:Uncharacterized protein n=1 Tax=Sulfurimonas diazotrophicus TaxID=3131939 RepID=A0ABZ3H6J3_9BACT
MKRSKLMLRLAVLAMPLWLLSGCFIYVEDNPSHLPYVPATLVIHNDETSWGSIWYAYAAPSLASSWGEELLGADVLYPGDDLVVDIYECDQNYDIRVEYEDGYVVERTGVWVPCDMTTYTIFTDY